MKGKLNITSLKSRTHGRRKTATAFQEIRADVAAQKPKLFALRLHVVEHLAAQMAGWTTESLYNPQTCARRTADWTCKHRCTGLLRLFFSREGKRAYTKKLENY